MIDNVLSVDYNFGLESSGRQSDFYPFSEVRRKWGDDVADLFVGTYGETDNRVDYFVDYFDYKDTITLIQETDTTYTMATKTTFSERLTPPEEVEWTGMLPVYEATGPITATTYFKNLSSLWLGKSLQDLVGEWVIPIASYLNNTFLGEREFFIHDKIMIQAEGEAEASFSDAGFFAEMLDGGILELRNGSGRDFLIQPYADSTRKCIRWIDAPENLLRRFVI